MDFINTGKIHCDLHETYFPPTDRDGKVLTPEENWRRVQANVRAGREQWQQMAEQDRLERRQVWQKRIARVLPCFAPTPVRA